MVAVAVNVTAVPAQMLLSDALIITDGTMVLPVTLKVILLLVAVAGDTQAALLVSTTLTESLLAGLLKVNVLEVPV